MVKKKNKKEKILKLKKEIEIKDFIIKELLKIITENEVIVREDLLKNINFLYKGENL